MFEKIFSHKVHLPHLLQHETKKEVVLKFLLILVIFLAYFIFVAMRYGLQQGFFVTILTWSFFVMCTPIADAGFLIDFPLRLVTNLKMLISEIFVWVIAILINTYAFFMIPDVYEKTNILSLFKHVLEQPIPFWSIIFLSAIGTFVSIQFGDELLDKIKHHEREKYFKHKNKYVLVSMVFIFVTTFVLYDFLLNKLGIDLFL